MGGLRLAAVALVSATAAHPGLAVSHGALRGSHFHPREKVRVTMTTTVKVVRVVKTNALGAFTLTLPAPSDPCSETAVVAVGAARDTARLKVMPRACPPSP